MIVADTSALVSLIHADEVHHAEVLAVYDEDPDAWVLPWAILPEVDYLLRTRAGLKVAELFLADLAEERWVVEWGLEDDLIRAYALNRQYGALKLGLVDGVVMALAERCRAEAIATLDLKHFGAVKLAVAPKLLPRDA